MNFRSYYAIHIHVSNIHVHNVTMIFMPQTIWRRLYKISSSKEFGTLYHLRNLINRRNITKKPDTNVAASEDFLTTVVEGHIVAAAMEILGMSSPDSRPSKVYFPDGCEKLDSLGKKKILMLACLSVIDQFVEIEPPSIFSPTQSDTTSSEAPTPTPTLPACKPDLIGAYSCNLLSLGLLFMEFNDGIREGDGERIIRCWRYFLPLFKLDKRTNYSVEAFILLAQYEFLFTERQKAQLKWSRTINTHGRTGKNISCDLHMEHLNRELKSSIAAMGSNVTDTAIVRAGKSLQKHLAIQNQFDRENGVPTPSGKHSRKSSDKDRATIIEQLVSAKVFRVVPGRFHKSFEKFNEHMYDSLEAKEFRSWMENQMRKLLMCS